MTAIRFKVNKVIERKEKEITFEGSYYGVHSLFTPKGFIAVYKGEREIEEGEVYMKGNYQGLKIISFGFGHDEIMKDLFEDLEKFNKK